MSVTKEVFADAYKRNTTERTCILLEIDIETLEKYLKMWAIKKKSGKNLASDFKINKIRAFNSKFYKENGFFPGVNEIQKRTKLPKQIILDLVKFHDCREVFHEEIFYPCKFKIHESFCNLINTYSNRKGLTFNEAFKSWTYNYVKNEKENRKGVTYCFKIDSLSLDKFKEIQDKEDLSSVELFKKLLNGYKGEI